MTRPALTPPAGEVGPGKLLPDADLALIRRNAAEGWGLPNHVGLPGIVGHIDALVSQAREGEGPPCPTCGGPGARLPVPKGFLLPGEEEPGKVWGCLPCAVLARHNWSQRALKAERDAHGLMEQLEAAKDALRSTREDMQSTREVLGAPPHQFTCEAAGKIMSERDAALEWVGAVRDELVTAGGAPGDGAVALANLRALVGGRNTLRDRVAELREPECATPDDLLRIMREAPWRHLSTGLRMNALANALRRALAAETAGGSGGE